MIMEFIQSKASMDISSSTYVNEDIAWMAYNISGYSYHVQKLGTSLSMWYGYAIVFKCSGSGFWVLGSAEIINNNPATMSKRQFVIPVPAISWLDLMQLTSWCDLFQDMSWGTGCSIKYFRLQWLFRFTISLKHDVSHKICITLNLLKPCHNFVN